MPARRLGRAAASAAAGLRGAGRGWVLLTVALGWFLLLGTRLVLPTVLPQVRVEFAIDNATAGLVMTLLWVGYSAMQFPSGLLSDRVGERVTLALSVAATAVATALFILAPNFALFVVASVLFGVASGLFATPRVTILSNVFPTRYSTAVGVTFAAGNVGAAALPVVGGFLAVAVGWRWGFGVTLVPLLLVAGGLWYFVPGGAGGSGEEGLAAPPRVVARRLLDVASHRTFLLSLAAMTLTLFVYQGLTAFLPTYLIEEKGLSQETASTLFGLFFASGAVSQYLIGNVADRVGPTRVLVVISGFSCLTIASLPFVDGLLPLAALAVLLGLRLGLGSVGNGYAAEILPRDVQGSGYGLFRTVFMMVGALGAVFVGVLASSDLFDEAFLTLAGITGVSVLIFARLPPADRPSYDSEAVSAVPGDDTGPPPDDATD